MRNMRSLSKAKSMLTRIENFPVIHAPGRTNSEVVDAYQCAHRAAHRLCSGSDLKPFVKRATLVRLEMTEADPAYPGRIYDGCNRLAYGWEQRSHSGMKQQRFFIFDQKLIEL